MMLLLSITVASVAAVMCSSLALVNGIVKRKAEQDEIDGRPSPVPPPPPPPPIVHDFRNTLNGLCPLCGHGSDAKPSFKNEGSFYYWLKKPVPCSDAVCASIAPPHMHVYCNWCQSMWLMALAERPIFGSDSGGDRHHHPAPEGVSVGDRDVE